MARLPSIQTKTNLIPATVFAQLPYWKLLTNEEQKAVERESQELARAMFHEGASKLEQGKHLEELKRMLEPYRCFVRHLKNFKMSMKTAYRYMSAFNNARRRFPEPVLQAILARGIDMVGETSDRPYGKYTPVVKALPLPKTTDKYEIETWVKRVEEKYREYRSDLRTGMPVDYASAHPAPDTLVKAAFRTVRVKFRRIPPGQKRKALLELFRYLLAEFDLGELTVKPEAAPNEYRRGPGKPRADGKEE